MNIDSKHLTNIIPILKNALKHKDVDLIKFDIEQVVKMAEQAISREIWRQSDIGKKEVEELRRKAEEDFDKLKSGPSPFVSEVTSDQWYARLKELGVDLLYGYSSRAEYEQSEEYNTWKKECELRNKEEEIRKNIALELAPTQPWQDFEGRTQQRVDKILKEGLRLIDV